MKTDRQIDQLLREADTCVKLAACGDVDSFAKASQLIATARAALVGEITEESFVLKIAERMKPHLAGRPAEIQGAVLAELLSIWIAGHYQGGQELMDTLLEQHVKMVRELIPVNAQMLASRQ